MKVYDLLEQEDFEYCVDEQLKEMFKSYYISAPAIIGIDPEDVLYTIRELTSNEHGLNLSKEKEIVSYLNDNFEDLYLPRSEKLQNELEKIESKIDSEENITSRAIAIQEFAKIIKKYATTEEEWRDSPEGQEAEREASDVCSEPSDPYKRYGVKPSDFF